jgi:hypothetical protein
MTITNALVPIETFLPSPISIGDLGVSLNHNPDRSGEEILLRVYTSDGIEDIYGPDGEEIVRLKRGELIDLYV